MKPIAALAAAFVLTASVGTGPALAQEGSGPSIKFNLLDIQGLVVGKTMTIDAAYGQENGVTVKTPFSFLIPTGDNLAIYVDPAHEEGSTYIKVTFATEDKQFVENVQFIPMTIGMGETEARLNAMADILSKQAFPTVVASYPQNKYIGWRETTVAGLDAVEVLGEYIDPQWGHMYARIIGYLNPDSAETVFAVANIAASRTAIENADEFPRTRSGVAMEQFKFLK